MAQINTVQTVCKKCADCNNFFNSTKCSNDKWASRCPSCNDKHYGRPSRPSRPTVSTCCRCYDAPATTMSSHGVPRCSACARTEAAIQSGELRDINIMCPTCPNGLRCPRDDKPQVLSTWCRDCNYARATLPYCDTTDIHQRPSQKCPNFVFKRYDGTYAKYCYGCWTSH